MCVHTYMCVCTHNSGFSLSLSLFFFFWFFKTVSLYSPGCPGTHSVDQAGLEVSVKSIWFITSVSFTVSLFSFCFQDLSIGESGPTLYS